MSPQTVVNGDQTVLKLVPANRLQAKVEISDAILALLRGLPVNVSVDSFPSGEFGYIQGTLIKLGSDALSPDQRSPQYRFPATVTLEEQSVESGNQQLNLQSGMGVQPISNYVHVLLFQLLAIFYQANGWGCVFVKSLFIQTFWTTFLVKDVTGLFNASARVAS